MAKSPSETPSRPGRHGGKLRSGNPGNKGGGRPKDEFKEMMRQLASGDVTQKQLAAILKAAKHPHFMKALEFVTSHGYGKATETVDVNTTGTTYVVHVAPKGASPEAWQRQYNRN